jgi:hypothetical protein
MIHQKKCDELTHVKNKYDKELSAKNDEIKNQKDEISRLTKISLIQQYDKQLKDQNSYIKILESQLEKHKNSNSEHVTQEIIPEKIVTNDEQQNIESDKPKKKKKKQQEELVKETVKEKQQEESVKEPVKEKQQEESVKDQGEHCFNPDNFEDINGYELIMYKNNYYLRDLETSEIYDIKNNKPNQIVGLINSRGKFKFN